MKKCQFWARVAAYVLLVLTLTACGGKGSPTNPTPTQTKVIRLEGDLNFGDVPVGGSLERTLRIFSEGTAPLTITGMTGPSGYTASWTNGVIPNGTSQPVTVRFSPTAAQAYNGTLTVQGDQTSGGNTLAVSGQGARDPFSKGGIGNTVFDMPLDVSRVRIQADYGGRCQNFIVDIGGRNVVNEILGTCSIASGRHYDGTHLVSGGVVEITSSNGVSWSIAELR